MRAVSAAERGAVGVVEDPDACPLECLEEGWPFVIEAASLGPDESGLVVESRVAREHGFAALHHSREDLPAEVLVGGDGYAVADNGDGATVFEEVHPLSGLVSVGVGTHRGQEIADRGLVVEACETVLETIPVEEACNGGWRLLRPVAGLPAERVEPVLERGTAGDGRLRGDREGGAEQQGERCQKTFHDAMLKIWGFSIVW